MPYSPKDFGDVAEKATMAPSELQPPLNFADGGAVNWAGDATVYNTQSQIGNMMATPGGFGSMAQQFTASPPFGGQPQEQSTGMDQSQAEAQGQGFDFNLGTILQPMPQIPPPVAPTVGSFSSDPFNSITPPLSGGNTIPPAMETPAPTQAPEAAMAKGGNVSSLIDRLKGEFSKRGLDFDRVMAQRLAEKGQKGDTMLAHINPQEAQMLKDAGGSGKINPNTGLPSFSGAEDDGGSETSSNYDGGGLDRDYYSDDTDYSSDPDYGSYGARGPITRSDQQSGYTPPERTNDVFSSRDLFSPASTMRTQFERAAFPSSIPPTDRFSGNIGLETPRLDDFTLSQANSPLAALANIALQKSPATVEQPKIEAPVAPTNLGSYSFLNALANAAPKVNANQITAIDKETGAPVSATASGLSDIDFAKFTNPAAPQEMAADALKTAALHDLMAKNQAAFNAPIPGQEVATTPSPTSTDASYKMAASMKPSSPFEAAVNQVVSSANPPPMPVPRPADLGTTTAPLTVASTPKAAPALPVADLPASTVPAAAVPVPVPRPPADIPAEAEAPPQTDVFGNIFSPKNLTNAAVSVFPGLGLVNTAAGLMGGQTMGDIVAKSGQPYATTSEINEMYENATPAPGVPLPPIPYRDMGEGNIIDNILKPFGLDTESTVARMAKPYLDQGMSESEAYTRASYDLRGQQRASLEGTGRGGREYVPRPIYPYPYPPPEAEKPPETPATPVAPVWSRAYTPSITNYLNYGYGPEGSYYKYAEGGPTGPLSKARK